MSIGTVSSRFPPQTPDDSIIVDDESHEFTVLEYDDGTTSTQYEYTLDKAPVEEIRSVTAVVDDTSTEFVEGTDYQLLNDSTIDFDVGGNDPDANTEFEVTYVAQPVIERYLLGHDEEVGTLDDLIEDAIDSRQVSQASGANLDRIGSLFGELGKRRGRSDAEYRTFLRSIVQSFKGRGTVPGLRFAIAAGIGTDPDNVIIQEDFEEVGYSVRVENVDTSFLSGVIADLAQLADPSGVELLAPPVLVLEPGEIGFQTPGSQAVDSSEGLGSGTLTLEGNSQLQ
jgi:hypothetical protein